MLKYVDIHIVTETKLDETFLESLFLMDGFSKPYRLDRNFIRDTISSKILGKHIFPNGVESIFVDLILENANGYFVEHTIHHHHHHYYCYYYYYYYYHHYYYHYY